MSDNNEFDLDLIGNAKHGYLNRQRFDMPCKRTASLNNAFASLWDGPTATYVFPATAISMQIVSSSASDAAAGTGARTIKIYYLDNNYAAQETTVTMNGVTPVVLVPTNILRINMFHIVTAGSGGASAGNISIQAVGGAVTYGYLTTGHGRARHPVYTVPAGMTAYVKRFRVSSASAAAAIVDVEFEATAQRGVSYPGVMLLQDSACGQYLIEDIVYYVPVVLPEKTDMTITAISAGAADNATVAGNISGWLE